MEDEEIEHLKGRRELYKRAFNDLKIDLKNARDAKTMIDDQISEWNDIYYADKQKVVGKVGADIANKEVAKIAEWMKPTLSSPFCSYSHPIRVTSILGRRRSRIVEKYLNNQYTGDFDRFTFHDQLSDVLLREGTVWIKSSWTYKEEVEIEDFSGYSQEDLQMLEYIPDDIRFDAETATYSGSIERRILVKNCPKLELLRNEFVLPDPSARCEDSMKFLIVEKQKTLSELTESGKYSAKVLEKLKNSEPSNMEESALANDKDTQAESYGFKRHVQTGDKARKLYKVIEYWGYYDLDGDDIAEPILAEWVDDYDILLDISENPMPCKTIPVHRAVFSAVPFTLWGNALPYFLGDNQRIKIGITRGILDNMSLSNNGQKFIMRGGMDYANFKKMRNGERHIITNRAPNEVMLDGKFNSIDPAVFNMYTIASNENQELSGVSMNSASITTNNKDDNANMQLTISQQKTVGLVTNISNLLAKCMKDWASMSREFLENEQIEELFGDSEEADFMAFKEATRMNINLKVVTDASRTMRLQQLNLLLQQSKVLGEQAPPDTIKLLTAEMFELFDMYERAEEIREYQPQPDPMQQEMAMVAIQKEKAELQKIATEIQEIMSKVQLNQATAQSKIIDSQAGANYKQAQSREKLEKADSHATNTALKPAEVMAQIEALMMQYKQTQNQNEG